MAKLAFRVVLTLLVLALCSLALARCAHALDHGFDPDDPRTKWMELKLQPDTGQSCCGKGDGYFVDRWKMNPDGSATVYIEDSGIVRFPDGTVRPRVIQKEFSVPREKVNPLRDDLDNPFDHSVVWITVNGGEVTRVWCFVRHPQGS